MFKQIYKSWTNNLVLTRTLKNSGMNVKARITFSFKKFLKMGRAVFEAIIKRKKVQYVKLI